MATKTIAWTTGSGNITLTYTGQGNGSISVASDENDLFEDREQSFGIVTTAGSPEKAVSILVKQKGKSYVVGTVFNFDYTGSVQEVTLPKGKYKLQCWGAQGGSVTGSYAIAGSKGGYSEGVLTLTKTTTLYVFVGGKGTDYTSSSSQTSTTVINGGWNGGGAGVRTSRYSSGNTDGRSFPRGGGGATDISTVTSALSYSSGRTTRDSASLLARCIVAGGGAGASARHTSQSTTSTSWTTYDTWTYDTYWDVGNGTTSAGLNYYASEHPTLVGKQCRVKMGGGATKMNINWYSSSGQGTIYEGSSTGYQTFTFNSSWDRILISLIAPTMGTSVSHTIQYATSTTSTSTSSGKSSGAQQGGGTSGKGQYPGTQTSAGSGGAFGLGASQTTTNYRYCGGGGGGGWYGGGTGRSDSSTSYVNYSGGGSGFVNTSANASSRPSGYTGLQLDSGTTTAGNSSHPSTSGGTETGHSGNGYAKITILDPNYIPNTLEGYTLLSYIQSSGRQYINTGIVPSANTSIELDFMYLGTSYNGWTALYGERGSIASTYFCFFINTADPSASNPYVSPNYAGFDPGSSAGVQISTNTRYTIKTDNGNLYINGSLNSSLSTYNTLKTSTVPFYLFALGTTSGVQNRNISARCYSFKMYDGETLIRDYIPVKRNSDGVCGLWDKVNEVFYSSGSGTNFTGV